MIEPEECEKVLYTGPRTAKVHSTKKPIKVIRPRFDFEDESQVKVIEDSYSSILP